MGCYGRFCGSLVLATGAHCIVGAQQALGVGSVLPLFDFLRVLHAAD